MDVKLGLSYSGKYIGWRSLRTRCLWSCSDLQGRGNERVEKTA